MRVLQHVLHVDAREVRHRHRIGNQAGDDRSIHHVRRAPVAEQEVAGTAPARPSLRPELEDSVDLLANGLANLLRREALADVHGQFAAQVCEAGMHLR